MIENPFIITEKVIPEYFCDRKEEAKQLIKLLVNGNNVVLISQRRVGKTGLIQFCYQQNPLAKKYIPIYVDILSATNLQEFTFLLGREVFDVIKTTGEKMWKSFLNIVKSFSGKIGLDPFTGLPSLNLQLGDIKNPEYTLKEIFNYLDATDNPCIVAIDEFQQIRNFPEKNVEALIRSHLLRINNCRMIFSGSEKNILSEMFSNTLQPFYQSASFMELKEIPKNIYVDFIAEMFRKRGKEISDTLAEMIYDRFDGITFYVQRVCNGIFANTPYHGHVSEMTVKDTIDGILSSYDTIYRVQLSQLTLRQKELLIAIAKERFVGQITSTEFINKYTLASASAVQTSLKSLIKSNIVIKTDKGYLIEDRFLSLWLQRNY